MSGTAITTVVKMPERIDRIESGAKIRVTPEIAMMLLEANRLNRPLSQPHVERIAQQIVTGKWRFNGDTIKLSDDNAILDGQHRLWAIIEAKTAVQTIIVKGIERDAFATIDTISKPRSLGDTVALSGNSRYRTAIGAALAWFIRWEGGYIETFRSARNRIENAQVEEALVANPGIVKAVERVMPLRRIANAGMLAFLYYITFNRKEALAERLVDTLSDPAGVAIKDPFYMLRQYMLSDHHKIKDPVVTIAVAIKALNAAAAEQKVGVLNWRNQGRSPEVFPKLKI